MLDTQNDKAAPNRQANSMANKPIAKSCHIDQGTD